MDNLQRILFETYERMVEEESFDTVRNSVKSKGVELDAYTSTSQPHIITLSRIVVPKENRGKGLGSVAVKELTDYADRNNKTIVLTPSTDFGASSVSRLNKFYKSFGFIDNKGRNKDFTISDAMYRLPKGTR